VEILWNTVIQEIRGDFREWRASYKNVKTNEEKDLALDGVFVEIGLMPNSDFVKDLVKRDDYGAHHR
jgi:alkyl hydroperoxide reductase subunit AhpF